MYAKAKGGEKIEINEQILSWCPWLQERVRSCGRYSKIEMRKYSCDVIRNFLTFINEGDVDCGDMTASDMSALIELGCECLDEDTRTDSGTLIDQIVNEDNVVAVYTAAYDENLQLAADVCKRYVSRQ